MNSSLATWISFHGGSIFYHFKPKRHLPNFSWRLTDFYALVNKSHDEDISDIFVLRVTFECSNWEYLSLKLSHFVDKWCISRKGHLRLLTCFLQVMSEVNFIVLIVIATLLQALSMLIWAANDNWTDFYTNRIAWESFKSFWQIKIMKIR